MSLAPMKPQPSFFWFDIYERSFWFIETVLLRRSTLMTDPAAWENWTFFWGRSWKISNLDRSKCRWQMVFSQGF
jgi:hypothetical protein